MNPKPNPLEKSLVKFGITELNSMQQEMIEAYNDAPHIILCSPTGTGKTLAFLIPAIADLDSKIEEIQIIILVPSRELAIQIQQVARNIGSGYKINAVYGGRPIAKDKIELTHRPAILIGTPGRIADHIRRNTFTVECVRTLILDEFDKSLEIGFDKEMKEIIYKLSSVKRKILTSATHNSAIPDFVGLKQPKIINSDINISDQQEIRIVISPEKDKLETLYNVLCHIESQPCIVFCNFKDSISRVSDFLIKNKIDHGIYHGGLEQIDRERALIKFRNGTTNILIATDLAARGIDIPEIKYIIHYHLPQRHEEFTHRNGRTARFNRHGRIFIIKWAGEELPEFISERKTERIDEEVSPPAPADWDTLFLSGGRKDKISKGDILGWILKKGGLKMDEVGLIEIKQDCSFIAIKKPKVFDLIQKVNNTHLKKRKIRVSKV